MTDRPTIEKDEYVARRRRLAEAARDRGWEAVVVFGRGGGTYDRHGDLLYLSGHYQPFVYLYDNPPLWSGRSHSLLVCPADGDPVLLATTPEIDPDVAVADVRVARDFAAEASDLLGEFERGGVIGLDVLPMSLGHGMPLERYQPAEETLHLQRRQKSDAELKIIRVACDIGTAAVEAAMRALVPGRSEGEAIGRLAEVVFGAGGQIYLLTLATADRIEHFTGRPLPGYRPERVCAQGELARMDLVMIFEGYMCDFGRSWVIGGAGLKPDADRFLEAIEAALSAACAAARAGATAGEVAQAGTDAYPSDVALAYPPHWGHGLGLGWEGPMLLPDNSEMLERGYALAIETAARGPGGLGGFGENNVLVGETAGEIITPAPWTLS